MNENEIRNIEDLIAWLGREKTDQLFQQYILEIIGREHQNDTELLDE